MYQARLAASRNRLHFIKFCREANLQQPSCWNSRLKSDAFYPSLSQAIPWRPVPSGSRRGAPLSLWRGPFEYWFVCPVCKRLKSTALVFPVSFQTATFNHSQRKGTSQAKMSDWAEQQQVNSTTMSGKTEAVRLLVNILFPQSRSQLEKLLELELVACYLYPHHAIIPKWSPRKPTNLCWLIGKTHCESRWSSITCTQELSSGKVISLWMLLQQSENERNMQITSIWRASWRPSL